MTDFAERVSAPAAQAESAGAGPAPPEPAPPIRTFAPDVPRDLSPRDAAIDELRASVEVSFRGLLNREIDTPQLLDRARRALAKLDDDPGPRYARAVAESLERMAALLRARGDAGAEILARADRWRPLLAAPAPVDPVTAPAGPPRRSRHRRVRGPATARDDAADRAGPAKPEPEPGPALQLADYGGDEVGAGRSLASKVSEADLARFVGEDRVRASERSSLLDRVGHIFYVASRIYVLDARGAPVHAGDLAATEEQAGIRTGYEPGFLPNIGSYNAVVDYKRIRAPAGTYFIASPNWALRLDGGLRVAAPEIFSGSPVDEARLIRLVAADRARGRGLLVVVSPHGYAGPAGDAAPRRGFTRNFELFTRSFADVLPSTLRFAIQERLDHPLDAVRDGIADVALATIAKRFPFAGGLFAGLSGIAANADLGRMAGLLAGAANEFEVGLIARLVATQLVDVALQELVGAAVKGALRQRTRLEARIKGPVTPAEVQKILSVGGWEPFLDTQPQPTHALWNARRAAAVGELGRDALRRTGRRGARDSLEFLAVGAHSEAEAGDAARKLGPGYGQTPDAMRRALDLRFYTDPRRLRLFEDRRLSRRDRASVRDHVESRARQRYLESLAELAETSPTAREELGRVAERLGVDPAKIRPYRRKTPEELLELRQQIERLERTYNDRPDAFRAIEITDLELEVRRSSPAGLGGPASPPRSGGGLGVRGALGELYEQHTRVLRAIAGLEARAEALRLAPADQRRTILRSLGNNAEIARDTWRSLELARDHGVPIDPALIQRARQLYEARSATGVFDGPEQLLRHAEAVRDVHASILGAAELLAADPSRGAEVGFSLRRALLPSLRRLDRAATRVGADVAAAARDPRRYLDFAVDRAAALDIAGDRGPHREPRPPARPGDPLRGLDAREALEVSGAEPVPAAPTPTPARPLPRLTVRARVTRAEADATVHAIADVLAVRDTRPGSREFLAYHPDVLGDSLALVAAWDELLGPARDEPEAAQQQRLDDLLRATRPYVAVLLRGRDPQVREFLTRDILGPLRRRADGRRAAALVNAELAEGLRQTTSPDLQIDKTVEVLTLRRLLATIGQLNTGYNRIYALGTRTTSLKLDADVRDAIRAHLNEQPQVRERLAGELLDKAVGPRPWLFALGYLKGLIDGAVFTLTLADPARRAALWTELVDPKGPAGSLRSAGDLVKLASQFASGVTAVVGALTFGLAYAAERYSLAAFSLTQSTLALQAVNIPLNAAVALHGAATLINQGFGDGPVQPADVAEGVYEVAFGSLGLVGPLARGSSNQLLKLVAPSAGALSLVATGVYTYGAIASETAKSAGSAYANLKRVALRACLDDMRFTATRLYDQAEGLRAVQRAEAGVVDSSLRGVLAARRAALQRDLTGSVATYLRRATRSDGARVVDPAIFGEPMIRRFAPIAAMPTDSLASLLATVDAVIREAVRLNVDPEAILREILRSRAR